MGSFRDIKRNARRDRHRELSVPAFFLASVTAPPVPCSVRLWTRADQISGGESQPGAADFSSDEERIRLFLPDFEGMTIRKGSMISVETGEGYRIEYLYPIDGEFQTARVLRLSAAECDPLPVPE